MRLKATSLATMLAIPVLAEPAIEKSAVASKMLSKAVSFFESGCKKTQTQVKIKLVKN